MKDIYARALAHKAYKSANKNAGLKNNLTATRAPLPTDDKDEGYDIGSTWKYNTHTYTCVDSTSDKAVWSIDSDIASFNTWSELLAALTVTSPSYIGKYIILANANGAPSSGITYKYGDTLTDYIVDGGSATILVNNQGETTYSVTCMPRTIVNPTISSVMLTPTTKPITRGYYIFTVVPTDGLPNNCKLNDICYFDSSQWSVWQSYAQANTVLVVGSNPSSCVAWRKFQGTWMSTADDYVPDGKEYQTGKLWNGKPVYRKCISGTTGAAESTAYPCSVANPVSVPLTGTILVTMGCVKRTDGVWATIAGMGQPMQFYVSNTGVFSHWVSAGNGAMWNNRPYYAWVEFTKS